MVHELWHIMQWNTRSRFKSMKEIYRYYGNMSKISTWKKTWCQLVFSHGTTWGYTNMPAYTQNNSR